MHWKDIRDGLYDTEVSGIDKIQPLKKRKKRIRRFKKKKFTKKKKVKTQLDKELKIVNDEQDPAKKSKAIAANNLNDEE